MKRYMLFGFDEYYPGGGLNDFMFDFESENEFLDKFESEMEWDYYNVLDKEHPVYIRHSFEKKELKTWVKTNVD